MFRAFVFEVSGYRLAGRKMLKPTNVVGGDSGIFDG